jgi:hypothetical protein
MVINENGLDRGVRLILSAILFLAAFFWVGGIAKIALYVLSAILLFTSLSGFCLLYVPFGFSTKSKPTSKMAYGIIVIIFIAFVTAGSYYSNFFTKKFFIEDYNRMNEFYKQTLFFTGQNKRPESMSNYTKLVAEYDIFSAKYSSYRPYALSKDTQFDGEIAKVREIISGIKTEVAEGDLPTVHTKLESVRPIFQDMLKRNNFSMLAITLVDFHDAMEKIISVSDAKDSAGVIAVYPEVDAKLKEVEAQANDAEIQLIRKNLDEVLNLASQNKSDLLSKKAAELKSSFVKVYLKRG